MKLTFFVLLIVVIAGTLPSSAQDKEVQSKQILFDPLFWKEDLRLNDIQCQRIKEINTACFEKLRTLVYEAPTDRSALKNKAAEYLANRSEQIWQTFQPRQKKKWLKLWEEQGTYGVN